ncbi:HipA domain-containing protein [Marispirochaeta sp.]|uniref:HipA domain-containing protein n=1 Tax=Marispirochaeta sp. TaxID=2038653 RepID=UPI0029C645A2|nr:HipA domain-containing protein [Marispirochaeta sp.]
MGRRRLPRALNILMNGRPVGFWQTGRQSSFTYLAEWAADPLSRPISLSMPIIGRSSAYSGPMVDAFFDNLLPDSQAIRLRIQSRLGTAGTNAFELLSEIGRDCVGAIQIIPEGIEPADIRTISGVPRNASEMAETLRRQTGSRPAFGIKQEEFRISLAGAQEKTAFLLHHGRWHRPTGTTPATHIFKRPLGLVGHQGIDLSTSLENEWLCLKTLEKFGIPMPKCWIQFFEEEKVLIVERFDRKLASDGRWWIRIPQEDFCQATACPSGHKYQSDGGPGIKEIAAILNGSIYSSKDKLYFFKTQLLFWLLAVIDGHAKNFSIFLLPEGRYHLTPICDVISAYYIAPVTHLFQENCFLLFRDNDKQAI